MALLFQKMKRETSNFFSENANAFNSSAFYPSYMAKGSDHDWFLGAWMETLRLKQIDLIERTGWDKRKVSFLFTGRQQYNRDILNELAAVMNIEPFELLMHPDDAMALRRMRESAIRIAAEQRREYVHQPLTGGLLSTGR